MVAYQDLILAEVVWKGKIRLDLQHGFHIVQ